MPSLLPPAPRRAEPAAFPARPRRPLRRAAEVVLSWFDSRRVERTVRPGEPQRPDFGRTLPFVALHVACVAVVWVGWSPVALAACAALYALRMFAITGFYHRYFSHRTFKTSRAAQLVFAVLGNSATQRGPLWWAAHHRRHHQHSDEPEDVHSPVQHGFWWSHVGWITSRANFPTHRDAVRDLARYPELRFLDRFDTLVPIATGAVLFGLGWALDVLWPGLGTSASQMLVWGYVVSTVLLLHATFTINSLSHVFGTRRYATPDASRNNPLLALITFGEGWHNNHHRYPASARQGFAWWEYDLTYYGLWLLARAGVVWDLKPVPEAVRIEGRERGRRAPPSAAA